MANEELSDEEKREENLTFLREKVMAFEGDPNAGGLATYTFPSNPGSKMKGKDVSIDIKPFPRLVKRWSRGVKEDGLPTGAPIVERADAEAYKAHGDKYLPDQFKPSETHPGISVEDLMREGESRNPANDWKQAKAKYYEGMTGEKYDAVPYPYPGFGGEGIGG